MTRRESRPSEVEITIARVYARALLSLAEEAGETEVVLSELSGLIEEIDRNTSFGRFLVSPLVEAGERRQSLERMFRGRMNDLLLDTLQVMNRKGRTDLVAALAEVFEQEYQELRGLIRVRVKTAVPLSEAARIRLREAISQFTGKTASLDESVDDTLIGGVVLHVGDRKIDSSVARELERLGRQFMDRATREIHSVRTYIEEGT